MGLPSMAAPNAYLWSCVLQNPSDNERKRLMKKVFLDIIEKETLRLCADENEQ